MVVKTEDSYHRHDSYNYNGLFKIAIITNELLRDLPRLVLYISCTTLKFKQNFLSVFAEIIGRVGFF